MTVIVLTTVPEGLRGYLTRWMLEISAGVFVGHLTGRVRDLLWSNVRTMSGQGRALLVYATEGEQRLTFDVHDHHWEPVDHDGVTLIRRPAGARTPGATGWSSQGRRMRFGGRRRRSDSSETSG